MMGLKLFGEFTGLFWLLLTLIPLLYLQARLHNEVVSVFFLISRKLNIALTIFSIIFFPGVVLHELSHWMVARLVGVRTGKIWLIPEMTPEGNLRMGYVETHRSDYFRDALIGVAPLIFGGIFVAYAGIAQLKLDLLWSSALNREDAVFTETLSSVYQAPDFWLWFYLIIVVSSMMLPSRSDRQAWQPMLIFAGLLLLITLLAGAGEWMWQNLAPFVDRFFSAVGMVFGISVLVHTLLLAPIILIRLLLNRITGLKVV